MKKNRLMFLCSLWIVLLSAVLGIFLLFATDKNSRESEAENRMLAAFPDLSVKSLADASFMSGFESFLSDAFFMRNEITGFTDNLTDAFNMLSEDAKAQIQQKDMEKRLADEGAGDAEEDNNIGLDEDADDEELHAADGESAQTITATDAYLWLDKVGGGRKLIYSFPKTRIATYADTLRIMLNFLPEDGGIYFAQLPLASIANRWTDQTDTYSGWGSTAETVLSEYVSQNPRIHVFNAMEILEPHMRGGEELFYRTDHHWNAKGAYILASEMIRSQGLPVVSYDEYAYKYITSSAEENGVRDTFEVLYPLQPTRSLLIQNKTTGRDIALMDYTSTTYRAYMNNSRTQWRRIITGNNIGRRALVICDSYGNAFTPYLLPYYDEVHMTDFRNGEYDKETSGGNISEMMTYYNIDDVYIIVSTANGLRKDNSTVYLRQYLLI